MRSHDLVQSGRVQLTGTVRIVLAALKVSHTYKDIAFASGVSSGLVSKIINQSHIPTIETLLVMCDSLGIDYDVSIKSVKGVRSTKVNGITAKQFVSSKGYQKVNDRIFNHRTTLHL